jgi:DNA topoisomerase-1
LAKDDDVLTIGMNRAVELLAQARAKKGAEPLKTLGERAGKPVTVHEGRYGPYVSSDGIHATLPKDSDPNEVTLEEAIRLIDAKAAKAPAKPVRKTAAKKAPAKAAKVEDGDAAEKKSAAKKPAAKKAPAKKAATKTAAAKKPAARKAKDAAAE